MKPAVGSVRRLFLLTALAAAAIAVVLGYFAGVTSIASILRGVVPEDQIARVARGAGLSILAAGAISIGLAALVALGFSARMERSFSELRDYLGAGGRRPAQPREVAAAARAAELATQSLQRKAAVAEHARGELASVLDAVGEGIVQIDADGRIVWLNRAAQELLRLSSRSVGQLATLLLRKRQLRRWLDNALAGDGAAPLEIAIDGRLTLVSIDTIPPSENPAGSTSRRFVLTFVDLTELRRLESVRRDFIANASHELKTPLTSIRGYSETLLTDAPAPDVQRRFLETIHKNADRMHRIVDDLLDLSRIESGGWQPAAEGVRVDAAAFDAWTACTDKAERKQLSLVVDDPDAAVVSADPVALNHVFSNLFDNAIRYADPGTAIRVEVRVQSAGRGGRVGIAVVDSGAGIPREALHRVFERFYRVDPARSRDEGGTGLGLSIVKHLVEAMGGSVRARSQLGQGTSVSFDLPAPDVS